MQMEIASRWLICQAAKSVSETARMPTAQYYSSDQKNGEHFSMGYRTANLTVSQHSGANDNRPD
jgi:hypothetical protein